MEMGPFNLLFSLSLITGYILYKIIKIIRFRFKELNPTNHGLHAYLKVLLCHPDEIRNDK
jgi:hypothetical protein